MLAQAQAKYSYKDDENKQSCLTRWIDFVATPKLKLLDVECLLAKRDCLEVMPLSLYICETLLYLRLHRVLLGKFESVSLPCLKTMRLELNVYANEAGLETLISSCPALEDLSVVRRPDDNVKVLRVHSQTLTSLRIQGDDHDYEFGEFDSENLGLLIDAPRLKYLKFKNELSGSKIISTPSSLAKGSIARRFHLKDRADKVDLQKRYMVRNFFTTISGVSYMKISYDAVEFIQDIMPLPQYCNLSYLKAEFFGSPESLPTFLENFPILKSLILVLHICFMKQISHSSVPRCLLSSLEFVKINSFFSQRPVEMEVARYFAENSVILKKLVLRSTLNMPELINDENIVEDPVVLRDLLELPRRSSTCEFVVC